MKLNNKRIFTLIIALIFICINFIGCQSDNKNKESDNKNKQTTKPALKIDYTLYKPYVENALMSHKEVNSYTYAQGMLYDIDKNGVEELLLIHETRSEGIPKCVYDIFTIKDDVVYPLVEDKLFFYLAGGPSGDVYLLHGEDGERYIGYKYTEVNPGYDTELYFLGTWSVFDIKDNYIAEIKKANYSYVEENDVIDYSNSTATIDDMVIPYKEFEEWLSQYESEFLLSAYSFDEENKLEDLLDKLS